MSAAALAVRPGELLSLGWLKCRFVPAAAAYACSMDESVRSFVAKLYKEGQAAAERFDLFVKQKGIMQMLLHLHAIPSRQQLTQLVDNATGA